MTHQCTLPVVDIRRKRSKRKLKTHKDVFQESQALMGDELKVLGTKDGWHYVEVISQPKLVGDTWEGMRGWVLDQEIKEVEEVKHQVVTSKLFTSVLDQSGKELVKVSYGTKLTVIDEGDEYISIMLPSGSKGNILKSTVSLNPRDKFKKEALKKEAKKFLEIPYLWGGCSGFAYAEDASYGVDCSGLIYLIHRVLGKEIPRDAHDQCKRAESKETLEAGDIIFYSTPERPEKIIHVMLYIGDGKIIEATECARKVREIHLEELFDLEVELIKKGEPYFRKDIEQNRILSFGSF